MLFTLNPKPQESYLGVCGHSPHHLPGLAKTGCKNLLIRFCQPSLGLRSLCSSPGTIPSPWLGAGPSDLKWLSDFLWTNRWRQKWWDGTSVIRLQKTDFCTVRSLSVFIYLSKDCPAGTAVLAGTLWWHSCFCWRRPCAKGLRATSGQ